VTDSGGPRARSVIVVTLGDSITAGTPGWDPSAEVRAREGATDPESQWQYWAARVNPRLEFRNCGVNRERTDQIAARLDACVDGADVLVVQGGINDVVQGRRVEEAAADLHAMVRAGKALGLRVAVANILPWNNGPPGAAELIRQLNRLVADAAAHERVPLLPFYETLVDPEQPTRMRNDWTVEGNHPSVEGHRRLGELAFRLPGPLMP
jgi:lysophospholipase L1-like esterase